MSRLGTDVMALACIAGGALVGGMATMGLIGDDHGAAHAVECATVHEIGSASSVVVSVGGVARNHTVVVAPEVRSHRHQPHCVAMEAISWTEQDQQQVQEQVDRARMRMDMARAKLDAKRMELDGMDFGGIAFTFEGMDVSLEGLGEEISFEIQEALDKEMARLEVELQRLDEIGR